MESQSRASLRGGGFACLGSFAWCRFGGVGGFFSSYRFGPNPSVNRTLRDKAAQRRLRQTLGVSVMETQLSDQKRTAFDAVHHAVLVRYAA